MAEPEEEHAPVCDHGVARRWLEKPDPYGWKGWFCAADVPSDELCLPIFVGPAYQYQRSGGRRWPRRRRSQPS